MKDARMKYKYIINNNYYNDATVAHLKTLWREMSLVINSISVTVTKELTIHILK